MQRVSGGWCAGLLLVLSVVQIGCEYVRPTLNAPLKKWDRTAAIDSRILLPRRPTIRTVCCLSRRFQAAEHEPRP